MAEFLLELCSEEIPARMQQRSLDDLKKMVVGGLTEFGLSHEDVSAYATPRRLTLLIAEIPEKTPDISEERKGPRVDSPDQVIQGFMKSAGLSHINQAEIVQDKIKGDFYVLRSCRSGCNTIDLLSSMLPNILSNFPWSKSMRWGSMPLRWVRPLRSILCLFGSSDGVMEIVPFEINGIASGDVTYGHRFMAHSAPLKIKSLSDYFDGLSKSYVLLDSARRCETILHEARTLGFSEGMELVEDPDLLAEVAGLVEWPVILKGRFEEDFLDIPSEVIRATIRNNQKCFVLRDSRSGSLAPHFIMVANVAATDGGKAIIAGNERVIAARLADARFFYQQDVAVKLEDRLDALRTIVFHEKLGSQYERVQRITERAVAIAMKIGADLPATRRAAWLSKADLTTGMVGEFPELQGIIGRYYALAQGEEDSTAEAIGDHYRPQGLSDHVPASLVSVAVSLADKLDMLVSFWSIGEIPTGSKDPYALRRAALGIIRILLHHRLTLPLSSEIGPLWQNLGPFFFDRMKIYLRERGMRSDFLAAAFAVEGRDDLVVILSCVEALHAFLPTEAGKSFLARIKRVCNILRIEEKKAGTNTLIHKEGVDPLLLEMDAEKQLATVLRDVSRHLIHHVARAQFLPAMESFLLLCPAIDAFFENVVINAEQSRLRENRLALLADIRQMTRIIADFSEIEI